MQAPSKTIFLICSAFAYTRSDCTNRPENLFVNRLIKLPQHPNPEQLISYLLLLEYCPHNLRDNLEEEVLLLISNSNFSHFFSTCQDQEMLSKVRFLILLLLARRDELSIHSPKDASFTDIVEFCRGRYPEKSENRYIRLAKRPLRIALCVSGQLRIDETLLSNWNENLFNRSLIDTYVHTWKRVKKHPIISRLKIPPRTLEAVTKLYDRFDNHEFSLDYPTLFQYLSLGSEELLTEKVANQYLTTPERVQIEDEELPEFINMCPQQKMAYKIQRCHARATQSGIEYDLIVRIRPDLLLRPNRCFSWRAIFNQLRDSRELAIGNWALGHSHGTLYCDDVFAVGTPEIMDLYANYRVLMEKMMAANVMWGQHDTGHESIGWALWFYGIRTFCLRDFRMNLYRPIISIDLVVLKKLVLKDAESRMNTVDKQILSAIDGDLIDGNSQRYSQIRDSNLS